MSLSKKGNSASTQRMTVARWVRIINRRYILQKNSNPQRQTDIQKLTAKGKKEAVPVYLSFFYKVMKRRFAEY